MSVYKFGDNCDIISEGDLFDNIHESFMSDIEKRNTPIAIHDSSSDDLKLARMKADEIINVSGAEVHVYIRTDNADFDTVWDSDADPTYWNMFKIKAFFKPQMLETELKKWGIDVVSKTEIVFSHLQIFRELGNRMLRIGDVIKVPYNGATIALSPKHYRITNVTPSGNFRYNWLYLTCQATVLTADITVRPDNDMPEIDEKFMSGGVYRESL